MTPPATGEAIIFKNSSKSSATFTHASVFFKITHTHTHTVVMTEKGQLEGLVHEIMGWVFVSSNFAAPGNGCNGSLKAVHWQNSFPLEKEKGSTNLFP